MEAERSTQSYLDATGLSKDPAFMANLCAGSPQMELCEHPSVKPKSRTIEGKETAKKDETRLDPLLQAFLSAETELLDSIRAGSTDVSKEFHVYEDRAVEFAAKQDSPLLGRRLLTRNDLDRMSLDSRIWKAKHPESEAIPRRLLLRGKLPIVLPTARPREADAKMRAVQLLDNRQAIDRELLSFQIGPMFRPEFDLIRSGVQIDREFSGPGVYVQAGPGSSFSLDDHRVYNDQQLWWASIHTEVSQGQDRGSQNANLQYKTTIDVEEAGTLALQVMSKAVMVAGFDPIGDYRFRDPDYSGIWIDPVTSWTLTHNHRLEIACQRNGQPQVQLVPVQSEVAYYQRWIDPDSANEYVTCLLGTVYSVGPKAEVPEGYECVYEFAGDDWWAPFYIYGYAGAINLGGKYPTISLFTGPCKITITERIWYWHNVVSSREGLGYRDMANMSGWLEPLNWSLFKVRWVSPLEHRPWSWERFT